MLYQQFEALLWGEKMKPMKCILRGKILDAKRNYFQCVYTRALAFSRLKNLLVKCQPFDRVYFFLWFSRFLFHDYKKYCWASKALDKVCQQLQLGKEHSCVWFRGWWEMSFTTTIVTFDPLLLVFQKMVAFLARNLLTLKCWNVAIEERKKTKQSKASLLLTLKPNATEITKLQQLSVVSGYFFSAFCS